MAAKKKSTGKKVGNKQAFAEFAQKATAAASNAGSEYSDDYMADLALAMQQETAFLKKNDKPYDHFGEFPFLGSEKTFYWKVQGAGVAGRYVGAMVDADVGELFVQLAYWRPVHPETGELVFAKHPDILEQFRDNPAYLDFVTNIGAAIFEADIADNDLLQAKVDAAKKK